MTLPPPKDSYKTFLWDYDDLLTRSDDECCYSLSEREVQLLLAQLDPISWKTRYQPTSTEIDQSLILHWRGNLARKLMSGCCPDDETLSRFTEEGVFQTSEDGGETWTDNPGADPRNDAIQNPPLPGEPGNAKKCAAADNVRDLFKQYRDNLSSLLDASPTLVALIAGILAFIAIITGISGAAIGISVLLMGLAAGLLELEEGEIDTLIDDTVLDQFRCLVYCRMDNDGRLNYEQWLGLLADIASTFSDFPELFFYQTVNAMGWIGVNNAGTVGVTTADDCGDCDCEDEGCATDWTTENLGGGDNRGTILGVFDGYIRVQSTNGGGTTQAVFMNSLGADTCCQLIERRYVSGGESIAAEYHITCGLAQTGGNLSGGMPFEGCYNFLAAQTPTGSNIPFVIEFLFAPCD